MGGTEFLRRGVHVSEVFFIRAAVGDHRPRQIVESGRALGQSTWLLSRVFPETPILSVELHPEHADAEAALKRLAPVANVSCLFGDSRVLLPELALPGDVVVIDGPKNLRALKLAQRVLERKRVAMVFIHDCQRGTGIRRLLERSCPWAFYSDEPSFLTRYNHLDTYLDAAEHERWSDAANLPTDRAYGGTFACVPLVEGYPSMWDRLRLVVARMADNVGSSARKRVGGAAGHEGD